MDSRNTMDGKEVSDDEADHHSSAREAFSLRAFSEMADTKSSSIIPQDLYKNPPSVVELTTGAPQTSDDTVIKRMTMGKMAKTGAFESNQKSTTTTPRRPNDKYFMCPSNTFIASNGDVYEIEPFMLPPPTEIAALFKELKSRRDRSDSNMSDGIVTRPSSHLKIADSHTEKRLRSPLMTASRFPRNSSFDSTSSEVYTRSEHKTFQGSLTPFRKHTSDNEYKAVKTHPVGASGCTIIEEDDGSDHLHLSEREHQHQQRVQLLEHSPSQSRSQSRSGSELEDNNNSSSNSSNNISQLRQRYQHQHIERPAVQEKPESSIGAYPSFLHTDQPKNREEGLFNWENFSLKKYLLTEMLGIGEAGHLQPTAVGNMQNFLTVPSKVEMFIVFGFFICVDAFLYVITFLPIRVSYSLYLLVCEGMGMITSVFSGSSGDVKVSSSSSSSEAGKRGMVLRGLFHRSHLYDLMRGAFMIVSCYVLMQLNMSRVYHYIRGQTLIKLYVLTAMLEIFDKLLCSFGQDAFDSLYCITRMRPEPRKIIFAFIITAIYTTIHSGVIITITLDKIILQHS